MFYAGCPSWRNLLIAGNLARPFKVLECTHVRKPSSEIRHCAAKPIAQLAIIANTSGFLHQVCFNPGTNRVRVGRTTHWELISLTILACNWRAFIFTRSVQHVSWPWSQLDHQLNSNQLVLTDADRLHCCFYPTSYTEGLRQLIYFIERTAINLACDGFRVSVLIVEIALEMQMKRNTTADDGH